MNDAPQPPGQDDWLLPEASQQSQGQPSSSAGAKARRLPRISNAWKATALVVAGLIAGGGTVAAAQAVSGDQPTAVADQTGPGGRFNGAPGAPGDGTGRPGAAAGPGGIAGEQHLQGTVTGTTSSSVTVKSSSGTATYSVSDQTQVVRNGAQASLSDLKSGDPVVVHVYPASDGGRMVAERIFAGNLPTGGDDGDGHGLPAGDGSGTGNSSNSTT